MSKLLLVEDNEMNRDMLSRRLIRKGYEVVMAMDGEQAVSMASSEQPDLILMDLTLPLLNGSDAPRAIKRNPDTAKLPIIALTAHSMASDRELALEAGCDDFDTKPIDFPGLLTKIETHLKRIAQAAQA